MEAKPTKVPLGGAAQLFLAGVLLEVVVLAVAFRASVVDFIEAQGVDVEIPARAEPAQPEPASPTPASAEPAKAPASPAPASEPTPARGPGTMQSIQAGITERLPELRSVCFETLGTPEDAGQAFELDLTVLPDGTVGQVDVSGPNATLRACLVAEASHWTFGAPGNRLRVTKTVRF